jgi:hypothetical protein
LVERTSILTDFGGIRYIFLNSVIKLIFHIGVVIIVLENYLSLGIKVTVNSYVVITAEGTIISFVPYEEAYFISLTVPCTESRGLDFARFFSLLYEALCSVRLLILFAELS